MHCLRAEGEEFPVLWVDRNLPKTLSEVEGCKEFRLVKALERILDPRQWINYLLALFVDLTEVGEESPSATLLARKHDRRRERADGVTDYAIGNHLIGLVVDRLPHFGSSAIRGDSDWRFVLFHVRTVMDKVGFAIVAVMARESFWVFDLNELSELFLVWGRVF